MKKVIDAISGNEIDPNNAAKVIIDYRNDSFVFGYTYAPKRTIIYRSKKGSYRVLNEAIGKKIGAFYNKMDGTLSDSRPTAISDVKNRKFVSFDFPYKETGEYLTKKKRMLFGIDSPSSLISEHKHYTFGVEIETASGYVNPNLMTNLNVKCVYDGSIYSNDGEKAKGGEYVTGVLKGDLGFIQLKKILDVLSTRTTINKTCSIHVHIGGVNFNKTTMVMLWKINQILEKELFLMVPKSRASRPHCAKIRNKLGLKFPKGRKLIEQFIDTKYDEIVQILSLGKLNSKIINKAYNHPSGHYCGYNTSTPRYWWVNYIPAIFNLKGIGNYTIEYRLHGASLNYSKIRNWVLIVMGIVYVAENHQNFLINNDLFTLKDVLKLAYPTKWTYLNKYVEDRKSFFNNGSLSEAADYNDRDKNIMTSVKDAIWDS